MTAVNFTDSPSNGDTFTSNGVTFTYSTAKGRWKAAGVSTASLTTEEVQDITGAMFTGNTETGITATYEDGDGTIDLVVSAAASADTLTTARTIGGVSFDGSADIALPPGGTDWDTALKTSAFTGVSGKGYLLNTTSAAITVTLPASPSAGNTLSISDASGTSQTNAITIARNGSNIYGAASDISISTKRGNISLIYTDSTNGWIATDSFALEKVYTLTGSAANVNEGVALTVSLATVNVSNGTQVPYTITGVTSADLGGVSLTGNFTINSSAATATFTPAEDAATEGSETMVLTLDGTSVALSTTINDTSVSSPAIRGTSYGYMASGREGPSGFSAGRNKYTFASNSDATSVPDIGVGTILATAFNSADYGYITGGLNNPGPGQSYASGSKWAFSNDNNVSMGYGTVSFAAGGSSTNDTGFVWGGHKRTNPSNYLQSGNGADSKVIEKHTFSNDSIANTGGSALSSYGANHTSTTVSSTHIYATHGFSTHNVIQKFGIAASSGTATDVGDLVNTLYQSHANASETKGYASGGHPVINVIQSYPFATDSNATDCGDLVTGLGGVSGSNSTTSGYKHGGYNQLSNVIQAFPFASEGNSSDIGDLTFPNMKMSANGNIQV